LALALGGGAALGSLGGSRSARWSPPAHLSWYWQLQGAPKLEPVQVTDIDGFANTAAVVARLHRAGRFARSLLGRGDGWPGERWLDVRQRSALEPIMTARFRMCRRKGFDAVEPDNIDGFENPTGFHISGAQQLRYDVWVAREVHSLHMAVFEKNDPEQARRLEPYFDGVLDEQCNQYQECGSFEPYLKAGKPVLNAEYKASLYPRFCTADRRLGIEGALFGLALDGRRFKPCPGA
jgi:hypothetical protein